MNDNTFTEKGARAMSRALRRINQLEVLLIFCLPLCIFSCGVCLG
jgi:hypothetical protein